MSSSDVKDNHATEHVHGPNCHHDITPKIGRNEPCSCGRHKKFKKCCGKS